jgi:hypothetical protein
LKILEARFKTAISRHEYEAGAKPKKYGAVWKIYGFDDEKSMATGIYLFKDVMAMNIHMENLKKMADKIDYVSDLELKVWDIQENLSKITDAPI